MGKIAKIDVFFAGDGDKRLECYGFALEEFII